MAERRMFAKTIIDSDMFLDMPSTTQCLYFHLSMRADDDGFINNPKKIQRMVGSCDDDLKLLIAKNFIIPFESGVVVIKHWKIHNYIQKDRYKPTLYQNELEQLEVDKSKNYQIKLDGNSTDTKCIHDVSKTDTQVRLGKDSIDKNSIYTEENIVSEYTSENLSSMSKLYQQNIGMVNGITGEWLIEVSSQIDIDLFKRALEICTERGNTTLGYLKGIIKKWLQNNITTYEQLKAYELQNKKITNNSIPQNQEYIQNNDKYLNEEDDPEFQRLLEEENKKLEELNKKTWGGINE